jgi:hypothetical protein
MTTTIGSLLELFKKHGIEFLLVLGEPYIGPTAMVAADDLETARRQRQEVIAEPPAADLPPEPYLDRRGNLVIPFHADRQYCWWAGGQAVVETLAELADRHPPPATSSVSMR